MSARRLRHVGRSVSVLTQRPTEGWDRLMLRFQRADVAPHPAAAVESDRDWERALHDLLGAPWPCGCTQEFEGVWKTLSSEFSNGSTALGTGLDGSASIGRACRAIVVHTGARHVLETGVARGITSRAILEGLEHNGVGELWSIDLPPLSADWYSEVGVAVPLELSHRWHYVRGTSRRKLPRVLEEFETVDLFVHDSRHSYDVMTFEMEAVWPLLRPGGFFVADDVHENSAFDEFVASHDVAGVVYARDDRKQGAFGVLIKGGGG